MKNYIKIYCDEALSHFTEERKKEIGDFLRAWAKHEKVTEKEIYERHCKPKYGKTEDLIKLGIKIK